MGWCRKSPEMKIGDYGRCDVLWGGWFFKGVRAKYSLKLQRSLGDSDGRKDLGLEGCS